MNWLTFESLTESAENDEFHLINYLGESKELNDLK